MNANDIADVALGIIFIVVIITMCLYEDRRKRKEDESMDRKC